MEVKKFGGYELKIFLDTVNKDFICPICSLFVRQPKECIICGTIFCESCLEQWAERNPNNISVCPMRCKRSNGMEFVMKPVGKVIKNIMNNLQVKCPNVDCGKIMNFEFYEAHQRICNWPKCQNEKCKKEQENLIVYVDPKGNEFKFCSLFCQYSFIFQQICCTKEIKKRELPQQEDEKNSEEGQNTCGKIKLEENNPYTNENIELTDWFHNFITNTLNDSFHKTCEKRISNLKNMIKAITSDDQIKINDMYYEPGITSFKWDNERKGQGIQVYNNGESLFLNENIYAFRSIVAKEPFMEGVHYFEITPDKRTESELKVGVTKNPNFNYDTSFSDYSFGWAFYGVGQLRHSNNANGEQYGKKFKKSGTLGVFLDMNRGILSFALDKEYFGIAFKSEELKTGPIYAAISLLHFAGCTLKTGVSAQPYFFSDE